MGGKWVVIHCSADDSHVLVEYEAVVCEEPLHVEDGVKFYYPGCRDPLEGVVKGISDDHDEMMKKMDDFNRQSKPTREKSFHEDQPRRAAVKCLERGFGTSGRVLRNKQAVNKAGPSTKSAAAGQKGEKTKQPTGTREKSIKSTSGNRGRKSDSGKSAAPGKGKQKAAASQDSNSDSSDSSESSDDSSATDLKKNQDDDVSDSVSSPDDELTPEMLEVIHKLAKKRKLDYKFIRDLTKKKKKVADKVHMKVPDNDPLLADVNDDSNVEESNLETSEMTQCKPSQQKNESQVTPPKSNQLGTPNSMGSHEGVNHNKDMDDKVVVPKDSEAGNKDTGKQPISAPQNSAAGKKKTKGASIKDYIYIEFHGQMLNYMPEEVQLEGDSYVLKSKPSIKIEKLGDHEIFVNAKDLKTLKKVNTPSKFARGLTRLVFTASARETCSPSGKPSFSKGQVKPEVRTPLLKDGVEAVIEYTQSRSKKKGWHVHNDTTLKQYMSNVMCEDRTAADLLRKVKPAEVEGAIDDEQ